MAPWAFAAWWRLCSAGIQTSPTPTHLLESRYSRTTTWHRAMHVTSSNMTYTCLQLIQNDTGHCMSQQQTGLTHAYNWYNMTQGNACHIIKYDLHMLTIDSKWHRALHVTATNMTDTCLQLIHWEYHVIMYTGRRDLQQWDCHVIRYTGRRDLQQWDCRVIMYTGRRDLQQWDCHVIMYTGRRDLQQWDCRVIRYTGRRDLQQREYHLIMYTGRRLTAMRVPFDNVYGEETYSNESTI